MKYFIRLGLVICSFSYAIAGDKYFAITETLNTTNGIKSTIITMTNDEKDCKPLLDGAKKGYSETKGAVQLLNSVCLKELPRKYQKAFEHKPINGVIYVSYTNIIWPTVVLMYNIDKSWFTKQGCEYIVSGYKSKDKNARCIYGQR